VTRHEIGGGIPTLAAALSRHLNADELKVLATLTDTRAPTRKAELVKHTCRYLAGDRLRAVWQDLDDLQRTAASEAASRHALRDAGFLLAPGGVTRSTGRPARAAGAPAGSRAEAGRPGGDR
jgi:hypothetical protein